MNWQDHTPPIRGLMALRAVAENGTFTRAAQSLGWNQPSVSKHLQALEQALGTRLLRRDRNGSELTEAGAQVLERAVRITDVYTELAATASPQQPLAEAPQNRLRLAVSPTLGHFWLPGALAALQQAVPDTTIGTRVLRGREAVRQVARREADLALVEHPPADNDLPTEAVGRDPLVAACHPSHPWAGEGSLAVDDFLRARHVLREPGCDLRVAMERELRSAGLAPPEPEVAVGSAAGLLNHLADGVHLTVASELALTGEWAREVSGLPLRDLDLDRPVWAVGPADQQATEPVAACLDHLRRHPVAPPA
jgi:DNA-binding transcriptional LysR family regulator